MDDVERILNSLDPRYVVCSICKKFYNIEQQKKLYPFYSKRECLVCYVPTLLYASNKRTKENTSFLSELQETYIEERLRWNYDKKQAEFF